MYIVILENAKKVRQVFILILYGLQVHVSGQK